MAALRADVLRSGLALVYGGRLGFRPDPPPHIPVEWSPPKFEAVDPQKDAMADLLAIRSGTMTLAEAISRQGRNPDAVLAEIAMTNTKLDQLGIVLDSDPRHVTKMGVAQAQTPGQPTTAADDPQRDD